MNRPAQIHEKLVVFYKFVSWNFLNGIPSGNFQFCEPEAGPPFFFIDPIRKTSKVYFCSGTVVSKHNRESLKHQRIFAFCDTFNVYVKFDITGNPVDPSDRVSVHIHELENSVCTFGRLVKRTHEN